MKIKHEPVLELIDQFMFLIDGIIEAVRMGDDGLLDNVNGQKEQISILINHFKANHLIKPIKIDKTLSYNKRFDYLCQAKHIDFSNIQDMGDLQAFVQGSLYHYLKKQLRDNPVPPNAVEMEIFYHVDNIMFEWPQLKKWESAFLYPMTTVLDDVVNEIKADRKNNPQLLLQF